MSETDKEVQCGEHGVTPAAFVCHHLQHGYGCGFHAAHDDATEDAWPDAWCDHCDAVLTRDGEWTQANSPDLAPVCTHCYELTRHRNRQIPEPIRPGQLSVDDDEYADLSIAAFEWCQRQRDKAIALWAFDTKANWHFDPEADMMRFFDNNRAGAAVLADAIVVGSFSTRSNTWAWVWDNPAYSDEDRAKLDPVRVFGEVRGIERLSDGYWKADEMDAWEMAQLAAYLLGAEAVYRAPYDHMQVFMLLRRFRLES